MLNSSPGSKYDLGMEKIPDFIGGRGRTRTGTPVSQKQILSLLCLPFHHAAARKRCIIHYRDSEKHVAKFGGAESSWRSQACADCVNLSAAPLIHDLFPW
jgi:hypothetical protein